MTVTKLPDRYLPHNFLSRSTFALPADVDTGQVGKDGQAGNLTFLVVRGFSTDFLTKVLVEVIGGARLDHSQTHLKVVRLGFFRQF